MCDARSKRSGRNRNHVAFPTYIGAFLLLILFVFVTLNAHGNASQSAPTRPQLYPIWDNEGRWGAMDQRGNVKIPPRYDFVGAFFDGYASVCMAKRGCGVINEHGDEVVPLTYNSISGSGFHDGLLAFEVGKGSNARWGYVDASGREIVHPRFFSAGVFRDGLAWVQDPETLNFGYIRTGGKVAITPRFRFAEDFHDGFAPACVGEFPTSSCGLIDTSGKFVVEPKYQEVGAFTEGLSSFCEGVESQRKCGFLLSNGTVAIPPRYSGVSGFSEGLAVVNAGDPRSPRCGFIDHQNRFVIQPKFVSAYGFLNGVGRAALKVEDGAIHWGAIDTSGKFVIKPQFRTLSPFVGPLAFWTSKEGRMTVAGYVDTRGNIIWSGTLAGKGGARDSMP